MEDRESELRQVKIDLEACQTKHNLEIERITHKHQAELCALQDKFTQALLKPRQKIEEMQDELRLKDVHIMKLKDVIDRQRRDLIQ